MPWRRGLPYVAAAVLFIGALTLLPSHAAGQPLPVMCLLCGYGGLADFLLNILLFAPLGAALAYAGLRPGRAVLLAGLCSTAIEISQIWIPGRDPSLGDVLSNTLGAALGVALFATAGTWLRPGPKAARWLAGGWAAAAALVAWATVLLVRPSYPPSVYYGQWTHDLGHLAWYRGRVLSAEVGNLPVPDGRAADSRALRTELERDAPIVIRAIGGPPVPRLGELFGIFDDRQRTIALVGPDQDDLVYSFRTRGEGLGLQAPEIRARGLLRGVEPGDSLRVVVSRDGVEICLSANGRRGCQAAPGVAAGWTLLVATMVSHRHSPAWLVTLLNAGWLIFLVGPIGYWGWRSVRWSR